MLSLRAWIPHSLRSRRVSRSRRRVSLSLVGVQALETRSLMSQTGLFVGSAHPVEGARLNVAVERAHYPMSGHGGHADRYVRRPAVTVLWNTLSPSSAIAISSQNQGAIPSQAADDFFFTAATAPAFSLKTIKVDGLFTNPRGRITDVNVQLYQSYPFDSNTMVEPPVVRTNGPSDMQFALFDSKARTLTFHAKKLGRFMVAQTITPGSTSAEGGVGPGVMGQLREIDITLKKPITLYPVANPGPGQLNHYWLAVTVNTSKGYYYWVASAITPTSPADRQTWIHTNPFDPNWHRVSDVLAGNNTNMNGTLTPAYSESFQLLGKVLPHG
jgi:hypothetical protein